MLSFSNYIFGSFWTPQSECLLVQLYWRGCIHLYDQTSPKLCKSHPNNLDGSVPPEVWGRICIFEFAVNCPFKMIIRPILDADMNVLVFCCYFGPPLCQRNKEIFIIKTFITPLNSTDFILQMYETTFNITFIHMRFFLWNVTASSIYISLTKWWQGLACSWMCLHETDVEHHIRINRSYWWRSSCFLSS